MVTSVQVPFSSISESLGANQIIRTPTKISGSVRGYSLMNPRIFAIHSSQSGPVEACCELVGFCGRLVVCLLPCLGLLWLRAGRYCPPFHIASFGHVRGAVFMPLWKSLMILRALIV